MWECPSQRTHFGCSWKAVRKTQASGSSPGKILCTICDHLWDMQNSGLAGHLPSGQGLRVPLTHVCVTPGWGRPGGHQAFACQRAPAVLPLGVEGQLLPGAASRAHLLTSAPKSPRQPLTWDSRPHAAQSPPAADAMGVAGDWPSGPGTPANTPQSFQKSFPGPTWPLQRPCCPPTLPPFPGDPVMGPQAGEAQSVPVGSASQLREEPHPQRRNRFGAVK